MDIGARGGRGLAPRQTRFSRSKTAASAVPDPFCLSLIDRLLPQPGSPPIGYGGATALCQACAGCVSSNELLAAVPRRMVAARRCLVHRKTLIRYRLRSSAVPPPPAKRPWPKGSGSASPACASHADRPACASADRHADRNTRFALENTASAVPDLCGCNLLSTAATKAYGPSILRCEGGGSQGPCRDAGGRARTPS